MIDVRPNLINRYRSISGEKYNTDVNLNTTRARACVPCYACARAPPSVVYRRSVGASHLFISSGAMCDQVRT